MRWLILCLFLIGCDSSPPKQAANGRAQRAERIKKAELAAQQPPKVTRHRLESGELLVLDVPVVLSQGVLDATRCYVWRDAEFKTASLQCPADGAPPMPDQVGPENDTTYRP